MSKDKSPKTKPTPTGGVSSIVFAAGTCTQDMRTAAQAVELVSFELEGMASDGEVPDAEHLGVLAMVADFLRREARSSDELVNEALEFMKSSADNNNSPTGAAEGGE